MKQTAKMESMLPGWLQLSQTNPLDPAGRQQYEDNFQQQYINPAVAQAQAQAGADGQTYGSYAGAQIGQLQAQGQLAKSQSGLDYAQQYYNDQLQGRQSYYSGAPPIIQQQNALDVNRGLNLAQMDQSQNQYQNSYNLGTNQALNQFALSNFGNQTTYADRINTQNQNRWNAISGGIGALGGIV